MEARSEVTVDKDGEGFAISSVHLWVTAKTPGIDAESFQSLAQKAKAFCPVSKLMAVHIGFEAHLVS